MALCLFPLLRLWPGSALQKSRRVQWVLHRSYKIFLGYLEVLGVCQVQIEEAHKLLKGNHLIVANHPTLLDIVLLLSVVPQADCIVKASAWRNPFFWGTLFAADYIKNDDPNALIETCVERLTQGHNIVIFPEGTRSEAGQLLHPFKRGAANIALRCDTPLTPVTIRCTPSTLTKAERWYDVPERPFTLHMHVGEPFDIEALTAGSRNQLLAARALTEHMEHYFLETGSYHGLASTGTRDQTPHH